MVLWTIERLLSAYVIRQVPDEEFQNLLRLAIKLKDEKSCELEIPKWAELATEERIGGNAAIHAAMRAGWPDAKPF